MKRLNHLIGLDDKEFKNEFSNLRKVQHENVVKLVGFCYESKSHFFEKGGKEFWAPFTERILCFEFMQGGTLDKHIAGTMTSQALYIYDRVFISIRDFCTFLYM